MNRKLNGQPHQVDGESTISELIEGFEIPRTGTQWKRIGNSYAGVLKMIVALLPT